MSRKNVVRQAGSSAQPWHLLLHLHLLSLSPSLLGNYRGKRKRITGRDVPNPYRIVLYHVLCMLPAIRRNREEDSKRERERGRNEDEEEQTKANSVARSGRRYRVEDIAREQT